MENMEGSSPSVAVTERRRPNGRTVLVTGGSGFVGSHIIKLFLESGYHVRTTVRSADSIPGILRTHPIYQERLTFFTVPNMEIPGTFDSALTGDVFAVLHTSSPFPSYLPSGQTARDYLLNPAINGTLSLLNSVVNCSPTCTRVILTSSFAAIVNPFLGPRPGYTYTEVDWNPISEEVATNPDMPLALSYSASKTYAERAAWDFMQVTKRSFEMISLCPAIIYGPMLRGFWDLEKPLAVATLNTSSSDVYRLMDGSMEEVPDNDFWNFIDVRDVALAHFEAVEGISGDLETVSDGYGRYVLSGGRMTYQDVCGILREAFPQQLESRVPKGEADDESEEAYEVDSSKATRMLRGVGFTGLKTCIVDMAAEFLRIEGQSKK